MSTSLIMTKIDFLKTALHPEWVDGGPGLPGPVIRSAMANNLVAELLRDIAKQLTNRESANKLLEVGKELIDEAARGLLTGWEDGDDLCPPYWHVLHYPPPPPPQDPWDQAITNLTWSEQLPGSINDVILAGGIRTLASLTTSEKASNAIKQIGEGVVKQAVAKVFDDYCGTLVKPLSPPKPKQVAA
jgi:hypothetical protein